MKQEPSFGRVLVVVWKGLCAVLLIVVLVLFAIYTASAAGLFPVLLVAVALAIGYAITRFRR